MLLSYMYLSLFTFSVLFVRPVEPINKHPLPTCLSFPRLQVAIIAGNFDLAEIIKVHKTSDVGELTGSINIQGTLPSSGGRM